MIVDDLACDPFLVDITYGLAPATLSNLAKWAFWRRGGGVSDFAYEEEDNQ
jgi:hypothetical protein